MSIVTNFKMGGDYAAGTEFFRKEDEMGEGIPAEANFTVTWHLENKQVLEHPEDLYEDAVAQSPKNHAAKDAYRVKYGSLSLKKFLVLARECVTNFQHVSTTNVSAERKFIFKMWNLRKMYLIFDDSFELLKVRMNQMIAHLCDQFVRLSSEIRREPKNEKMSKYADMALELMYKVECKVVQHLSENIWLLMLLSEETKMHYVQIMAPELLVKFGRLQKRYWVSSPVLEIAAPKYYTFWENFWTPFLFRNFRMGGDVCRHIAEYIPYKLEHSSFLDFFRKHYNMREYEYTTERIPFQVEQKFFFVAYNDIYVSEIDVVLYNVFSPTL